MPSPRSTCGSMTTSCDDWRSTTCPTPPKATETGRHPPRARCGNPSPQTSYRGRGSLQGGEQGADLVRVVVPDTVDVEGRRAIDAAPHAAHEVLAEPLGVGVEMPVLQVLLVLE